MNTKKMLYALLPIAFVFVSSCSDEERDGGGNRIAVQKHTVKYKFYSDDGSRLHVEGHGDDFEVKGPWESEFVTDEPHKKISVNCTNCNALITGEIYVDGKLKAKHSRNSRLQLCVDLKPSKQSPCDSNKQ